MKGKPCESLLVGVRLARILVALRWCIALYRSWVKGFATVRQKLELFSGALPSQDNIPVWISTKVTNDGCVPFHEQELAEQVLSKG